jgi:tRNA A-37 threonylcarbamoyl transferase component Bud32
MPSPGITSALQTRVRFRPSEVGLPNEPDEKTPERWIELMWQIAERKSLYDILPDRSPYIFDGYEAYSTIVGGMGMVILGRDPKLDRNVAIKLWKHTGPKAEAALIAEAKTLAKLSHPNVVTVYGVGKNEDGVYFVMEYVEGENGHDWIERRPGWQEIREVFVDAGRGLAAAHDAGIQHGDFKPANILIGADGRTRVADFGVADKLRVVDGEEQRSERMAGTPEYMAPERLRGHRGDARSDQFSFCVAMWRALHGSRPYGGETDLQLLDAIETGAIRPGDPRARVPHWLTHVVRKGLAEDPDRRYRDMHELLRALAETDDDETAADESDEERLVAHEGRLLNAPQRERWPYVAIGFLSALVLVLGFNVLTRPPANEPAAETVRAEPYELILQAIDADDFEEVERLWSEHKTGAKKLTDAQSLELVEACLDRARDLESVDRALALDVAWTAHGMARAVERSGRTAEARTAGAQTTADAWLLIEKLER